MTSLTSVPSCVLPSIVKRRVSRRSFAQIMNWAIGAIEVLSLIVFVGFAVDYCLHLSQSQILISPHQVEWAKSQIGISNQRILYIQTSANLICWRWCLFWGRINTIPATSLTSRRRMMRKKRCHLNPPTKAITYIMIVIHPWTMIQVNKMLLLVHKCWWRWRWGWKPVQISDDDDVLWWLLIPSLRMMDQQNDQRLSSPQTHPPFLVLPKFSRSKRRRPWHSVCTGTGETAFIGAHMVFPIEKHGWLAIPEFLQGKTWAL